MTRRCAWRKLAGRAAGAGQRRFCGRFLLALSGGAGQNVISASQSRKGTAHVRATAPRRRARGAVVGGGSVPPCWGTALRRGARPPVPRPVRVTRDNALSYLHLFLFL